MVVTRHPMIEAYEQVKVELSKRRSTDDLVTERGQTHGKFSDHARATQKLKGIITDELIAREARGAPPLDVKQREALEMIAHKIGRIIAGDPTFQDHWDDIAGYARIANDPNI